jgi:hypothetical protein
VGAGPALAVAGRAWLMAAAAGWSLRAACAGMAGWS